MGDLRNESHDDYEAHKEDIRNNVLDSSLENVPGRKKTSDCQENHDAKNGKTQLHVCAMVARWQMMSQLVA